MRTSSTGGKYLGPGESALRPLSAMELFSTDRH
jgi:hypothetical protein